MKNQHKITIAICALVLLGGGSAYLKFKTGPVAVKENLIDEALLALIKNDEEAFVGVIEKGVKLDADLPVIEGKTYTVAEGLAYFGRPRFIRHLKSRRIAFIKQDQKKEFDIVSLSIPKNDPELLGLLIDEKPRLDMKYGVKEWGLLHLASSVCAHKLTAQLHEKGNLSWEQKAKDGSTPLTLAAEYECLPVLSYWKERHADFNKKDGRGMSALSILRKKKDAALVAFAESFESRKPAQQEPQVVNFYRKRIPKEQRVDHAAMIEPDVRPLEATETAEFSEFAD